MLTTDRYLKTEEFLKLFLNYNFCIGKNENSTRFNALSNYTDFEDFFNFGEERNFVQQFDVKRNDSHFCIFYTILQYKVFFLSSNEKVFDATE